MFSRFPYFHVRGKRGQQMMEHLLVILAVVVVFIFVTGKDGLFRQVLNKVINSPEAIINRHASEDLRF